ncbi:hypothetical protein ZTR_06128 [Talaromyces verruculosus]|nr:hypothetical protein ZTR_06128 [Talaromyces verruculosus]
MNHDSSVAQDGSPVNGAAKLPFASDTPRTLEEVAVDLRRKVFDLLELQTDDELLQNLQKQVRISMKVIEDSFKRYKYNFEELSLSYNGGKDCLVLLVLILACLPESIPKSTDFPQTLQSIYIKSYESFDEVDGFVDTSAKEYFLDLTRYELPMRAALEEYLKKREKIKAIWIGTRRTDPNGGHLTHFDPTDGDWPRFMRIHPVIDWHYAEIWAGWITALYMTEAIRRSEGKKILFPILSSKYQVISPNSDRPTNSKKITKSDEAVSDESTFLPKSVSLL